MSRLDNINVAAVQPLVAPAALREELPLDAVSSAAIGAQREAVGAIIDRQDPRLLVVCGPCSIHDLDAAREYLERLAALREELAERLFILMRVYFEKPRTTVGWKGLINDPHLDDSFDIETGLRQARGLLLELAAAGMPAATEALDPVVPQYIGDLVSWYAIGARTTESQTHREMASGLSAPCGFKNGTDGSIDVAINAMQAAATAHAFLGIDASGRTSVVRTAGNPLGHVILRGGREPNYDDEAIAAAAAALRGHGLRESIVVDCSHGNSRKDPGRQAEVARAVCDSRARGERAIVGLMLESHLHWGNQAPGLRDSLRYGVSITDACMDWRATADLLRALAENQQAG